MHPWFWTFKRFNMIEYQQLESHEPSPHNSNLFNLKNLPIFLTENFSYWFNNIEIKNTSVCNLYSIWHREGIFKVWRSGLRESSHKTTIIPILELRWLFHTFFFYLIIWKNTGSKKKKKTTLCLFKRTQTNKQANKPTKKPNILKSPT